MLTTLLTIALALVPTNGSPCSDEQRENGCTSWYIYVGGVLHMGCSCGLKAPG